MKTLAILATSLVSTLGLLAGASFSFSSSPSSAADTYQVDTVHSSMVFRVKHLGTSYFYGRFNNMSGSFSIDDSDPGKSAFQVQIQTESIDTANTKRDQHLKSPDFFNSKQFPVIGFKSTQVRKTADDSYEVAGDLTLHGVTKPVTAKVARTGSGTGFGGRQLMGVEAHFAIKRSDFGMKFMLEGLSDDVQITVSLEGVKQ